MVVQSGPKLESKKAAEPRTQTSTSEGEGTVTVSKDNFKSLLEFVR